MIVWVFVTVVLMSDGEVREVKQRFESWDACEKARIAEAQTIMPSDAQARILRRCRPEVKA